MHTGGSPVRFSFNNRETYEKNLPETKTWTINFRSYKHFSNEAYRESLKYELSKEVSINNDDGLQRFCDINNNILNRHAPCERKHAQDNQMPFVSLLKKSEKQYFENLNEKDILNNNLSGKTIKSYHFLIRLWKEINLFEKGESVKTESKYESFTDNIEDQTLREILKYKNLLSIITIQYNFKGRDVFYFS